MDDKKEKNELDLSMISGTKNYYDIFKESGSFEQFETKSIKQAKARKAKRIYGELYPNKGITRENIMRAVMIASGMLLAISLSKQINKIDVVGAYNVALDKTATSEMSVSESIQYLNGYDTPSKEKYANYEEALATLDKDDYKINGDRKDGTHNDLITPKQDAWTTLSDKQKDAIEIAVQDEINDYLRSK